MGAKILSKIITVGFILTIILTPMAFAFANTAFLITDKEIYEPGETVIVSGYGYNANTVVSITVTKPDPVSGFPEGEKVYSSVYSDSVGSFIFTYLINDNLFGDYKVEASDGTNVAVITFFDPKKVDMEDEPLTTEGTENTTKWLYGENPQYYEVQAALDDKFRFVVATGVVPATTKQYTFTDLQIGNTYYYNVRAVFEDGKSSNWSKAVSSQQVAPPPPPDTTPPAAPTGVNLIANINAVNLTWNPNTEADVAGYKISYGQNGVFDKVLDVGKTTSYKIEGLNSIYSYNFAVSAYDNASNNSNMSAGLSVQSPTAKIIEVNQPGFTFTGTWLNSTYSTFQGRLCKYTRVVGSTVTYQFYGTGISWLASRSKYAAIGKVYIDDVLVASVDCYSPTSLYQQFVFSKNGLALGNHKIKIVFTGEKNAAASTSGLSLDVDAFKTW